MLVQIKLSAAPSGSDDAVPSSVMLFTGRSKAVSLPAFAIGGLFFSRQSSQEYSLRHARVRSMPIKRINADSLLEFTIHFLSESGFTSMITGLKGLDGLEVV